MTMTKKSVLIAAIAIFAVPLFSSAQTANSGGSAACYPFSRQLSIGVSGSDVTALQNYLYAQGYLKVMPTGYFGVLTKAAVGSWQAQNNIAPLGGFGNGFVGPLSRGFFSRLCVAGNGGGGVGGGTGGGGGNPGVGASASSTFSATPQSGIAPLTVQFVATAPQGSPLGNAVSFGDGTTGNLGFVPVCSNCNAEGIVSHTYTGPGTYTATLTSGTCSCPANGVCNCPAILILATTTVVVDGTTGITSTSSPSSPSSTSQSIQQLNSPGSVTLAMGGIAEIRNESAYFTLENITAPSAAASSSATIQITPVGCWNSFPSDPPPEMRCMLAMVPIPPQTLAIGQTYTSGNYSITLSQLGSSTATFGVN